MQGLLQHEVLREAQLLHGSYQKALDRLLNQACLLLPICRRMYLMSAVQHSIQHTAKHIGIVSAGLALDARVSLLKRRTLHSSACVG